VAEEDVVERDGSSLKNPVKLPSPAATKNGRPKRDGRGMPRMPFGGPVRLTRFSSTVRMISLEASVTRARRSRRSRRSGRPGMMPRIAEQSPASGSPPRRAMARSRASRAEPLRADGVGGGAAEIEQAGEADDDVQPAAEHDTG